MCFQTLKRRQKAARLAIVWVRHWNVKTMFDCILRSSMLPWLHSACAVALPLDRILCKLALLIINAERERGLAQRRRESLSVPLTIKRRGTTTTTKMFIDLCYSRGITIDVVVVVVASLVCHIHHILTTTTNNNNWPGSDNSPQ